MSPRTATTLALLGLLLSFSVPVFGKETIPADSARVEKARQSPTQSGATPKQAVVLPWQSAIVDMSRDPMPLTHGPIVIGAFHIFPAQQPGPYIGPPGRIWGLGFGTSLWRDPVTGRPEM